MRVIIGSAGSRSDLHFVFALAKALHERNHAVTLVAPEKYRSQAMKMDVRMITCGRSFEEYLETDGTDRSSELVKAVASHIASQFVSLRDALREADVLVSGTLLIPAASMAEKSNLPFYQMIQSPLLLNRQQFPSIGVSQDRVSGFRGAARRKALKKEWEDAVGDVLNREREFSHLSPVGDFYAHVFGSGHQLVNVDSDLAAVEEAANRTITGYMPLEALGEPDSAAMDFLSTGQKPVYVAPVPLPAEERVYFVKELAVALASSGYRMAVRGDWPNVSQADLPEGCYLVDPAEEVQFLARSLMILHDGAAGLTSCGARAGIPQVIVPYLADQYFWADKIRFHQIGIDVPGKAESARIIRAVQQAVVDETLRQRAATFAEKLRIKNGVAAAADLIEHASGE
jgi:sterol 3beta-glucosyltransferase